MNGLTNGADYGDDAMMATNYPLVYLVDATGTVRYCRTYNHSTMGVATGSTPVSTQFKLPAGLPNGAYSLYVTASGVSSNPYSFTVERPALATGLAATGGNAQVSLTWNASTGATIL